MQGQLWVPTLAAKIRAVRRGAHAYEVVCQLLAEGHSMKAIAALLHVTPRTVAFHKYEMMKRLGLKTNAELIHFATKNGLVSP